MLDFDQYARKLELTVKPDGSLDGVYEPNPPSEATPPPVHRLPFAFHARRAAARVAGDANPPNIDGVWILPANSRKHDEKSWRFIVRQSGANVSAAILRIDGDTGALTGQWRDGKLTLSDFTGDSGLVLDVVPAQDGTLALTLRSPFAGTDQLTAYRPDDARAKDVAPADPMTHTGVKDPNEPFAFSFPDVDGKLVSSTDLQFKGKVVIVDVSGSWCPNCHDEAPFLQEMYRDYHARGLEVVTLDFEEREQMESLARLRAFIRRYGLEYTVLGLRHAGSGVGQDSPGAGARFLAHHLLHRPRRQGQGGAYRLRRARQRRVPRKAAPGFQDRDRGAAGTGRVGRYCWVALTGAYLFHR